MLHLQSLAPVVLLLWGFCVMPLSILLAARFGLVDVADARKTHTGAVPRGGGIALWTGMMFWCLVFAPNSPLIPYAMTGGTIVFFAGYLDDMKSLSPFTRLAAHFFAAGVGLLGLYATGVQTTALGYCVAILWIAGSTNAYNFIDGMNGLSLSMTIISAAVMGAIGLGYWSWSLAALALGCLPWNFPKARTFMGDGGVYLVGYFIGLLQASGTINWLRALWAIPVLLCLGGLPTLDTLRVALGRIVKGHSPFYPDRTHLHHLFLDRGVSPLRTLGLCITIQIVFGVLAWGLYELFA